MARTGSGEPKRRQRKNRDGSVSTIWVVDYLDHDDKRRRISRPTKAEALRARDDVMFEMRSGSHAPDAKQWTVGGLLDLYLDALRNGGRLSTNKKLRPQTIEDYAQQIENWVRPRMGVTRLSGIDAQEVAKFRDWLVRESGAGQRSREIALTQLKAALKEAHARGLIGTDSWSRVAIARDAPSQAQQRVRPGDAPDDDEGDARPGAEAIPDGDEISALVAMAWAIAEGDFSSVWQPGKGGWRRYHASSGPRGWRQMQDGMKRYAPLIELAVLTGLRQSELRGLCVGDVDFEQGDLFVHRSVDKKGRVGMTKSQAGHRTVPLAPRALEILAPRCQGRSKAAWLFPSREDTPIDRSSLYQYGWVRLLEMTGLPRYRFHALRHFFASRMIEEGAEALELTETLGHADVATTYNIYGHLLRGTLGERRRRVGAISTGLGRSA